MNILKVRKSRKVRLSKKRKTLNSASIRSIAKSTQSLIQEFQKFFKIPPLKRNEFLDMKNMIRITNL